MIIQEIHTGALQHASALQCKHQPMQEDETSSDARDHA